MQLFRRIATRHMIEKYKILLVDDHKILLDGTSQLLSDHELFEVSGVASNGKEAINQLTRTDFDILITDYEMPDMNGQELAKAARSVLPEIKIIVLSMHDDPSVIRELLKTGIDGFVLKNDPHSSLLLALVKVTDGKKYFSDEIAEILVNQVNAMDEKNDLSTRETEILKLIARDFSTKQIAEILFISEKTVETHRKNILRKTGASTVVGLVNYAHEKKLI